MHVVPLEPRRLGRRDGVPPARTGNAVDSGRSPVRAGVDRHRLLGQIVEAGLARELLVDRLAPEDHWGSISP